MKRVGLSIYGLSLYDSEKEENINLNQVKDSQSIVQLIKNYIDDNGMEYTTDVSNEKVYKFTDITMEDVKVGDKEEYSILYGVVKTGEYGVQAELFDISDNSISEKKSTQAEVLPFGFCIALAKGEKTKAVLILQTLGNLGIKRVFSRYLYRCISYYRLGNSMSIQSLYPIQYIDRILQRGTLQKIRMIRYEMPEEITNRIGVNLGVKLKEERVLFKPVGFVKNNKNKILECLRGQRASTNIIEIPDFDYDQLKFEFQINNKQKTINFNNTEELRVNEDITDEVKTDNGIPVFQSLQEILKQSAYEYLKLIGFVVEPKEL